MPAFLFAFYPYGVVIVHIGESILTFFPNAQAISLLHLVYWFFDGKTEMFVINHFYISSSLGHWYCSKIQMEDKNSNCQNKN